MERGVEHKVLPPSHGTFWQFLAAGRGVSLFFKSIAPWKVSHGPGQRPHIQEYLDSTNWPSWGKKDTASHV